MTRSAEQQARRYLALFPAWMRADRGEEAVGLVLDQRAPGADRLPLGSRLDLLRAGVHARRRGTPPARVRRLVMRTPSSWTSDSGAVPIEWRPWLISTLQRRTVTWQCAFLSNQLALVFVVMLVVNPPPAGRPWLAVAVIAGIWLLHGFGWLLFRRKIWRARVQLANGLGADGRPLPPGEATVVWTRAVVDNVWILPFVAAGALAAVVGTPITWFLQRTGTPDGFVDGGHATALATVLVVVGLVGWAVERELGRVTRRGVPAPTVTALETPLVASVIAGLALGGTAAFGAVVWALFLGTSPLALAAVPVAGLLALVLVLGAERRLGRRIGAWDCRPWWAPQQVVRRVQDLPPPPGPPPRPAVG